MSDLPSSSDPFTDSRDRLPPYGHGGRSELVVVELKGGRCALACHDTRTGLWYTAEGSQLYPGPRRWMPLVLLRDFYLADQAADATVSERRTS